MKIMTTSINRIKHFGLHSRLAVGCVSLVAFAAVGTIVIMAGHASTPTASIEAENGSLNGNASSVSDAAASGGRAVKFASGVTSLGCQGTSLTPGGSDGMGGCFPAAYSTGYPHGLAGDTRPAVTLSTYTGPCTITVANTVIDSKLINCGLTIQAANVKISRSMINGTIDTDDASTGFSFDVSDTEVNIGQTSGTGIGSVDYTAERVNVYGGNRSIYCWHDCTVTDSYAHDQFTDPSGTFHESAMRMSSNTTYRHNSVLCNAPDVPPDGGCSADLTGYGDFGVVQNNIIDKNLFVATTGGYCTYGGTVNGKVYPIGNHITFSNNIWQRGTHASDHGLFVCGYYGSMTDFDPSQPGDVWTNNKYDDGTILNSDGTSG